MAVCQHLAMTAAEISAAPRLPEGLGYMACHFSAYGTGLSNIPEQLPKGTMLILNDRVPICGHDHIQIVQELSDTVEALGCGWVLLDFQRPECQELADLAALLVQALPCPVGVSHHYAQALACPVLLPPVPLCKSLTAHTASWVSREIWLELADDSACIAVTKTGSTYTALPGAEAPIDAMTDDRLHCSYTIQLQPDRVIFSLYRSEAQRAALLEEAQNLGITRAIGLYQELAQKRPGSCQT